MNYEAILFDFDGVLADTEPIHWACWSEVLTPYGLHVDWETYRECCVEIKQDRFVVHLASLATAALVRSNWPAPAV